MRSLSIPNYSSPLTANLYTSTCLESLWPPNYDDKLLMDKEQSTETQTSILKIIGGTLKSFWWKIRVKNRVLPKILSPGDILGCTTDEFDHRLEGFTQNQILCLLFQIYGKYSVSEGTQLCTPLNTARLETLHDQVLKTHAIFQFKTRHARLHLCIIEAIDGTVQHEIVPNW